MTASRTTNTLTSLLMASLPALARAQTPSHEPDGTTADRIEPDSKVPPRSDLSHDSRKVSSVEDLFGEYPNAVSARFAYSRHVLSTEMTSVEDGFSEGDDLYGFALSYERVLINGWLTLEITKPFLWGKGRFDSPLDIVLLKPFRVGHHWDFYAGAGATLNVRIFDEEHTHIDGQANELSAGILLTAGVAYFISRRWGVNFTFDYAYIPGNVYVTHEISPSIGPVYAFQ